VAYEGSSLVEVDEAGLRVRPANKRCTVILREIPQDTRVEVILVAFIIMSPSATYIRLLYGQKLGFSALAP